MITIFNENINVFSLPNLPSKRKVIALCIYCQELILHKLNKKYMSIAIESIDFWKEYYDSEILNQKKFDYLESIIFKQIAYCKYLFPICNAWFAWRKSYQLHGKWPVYWSEKKKALPYYSALLKNIPKTPFADPFEIIVYLQDQLEYPILDGNRLNLWDKEYEYQVTGSIEEIAKTPGIRNLLNA